MLEIAKYWSQLRLPKLKRQIQAYRMFWQSLWRKEHVWTHLDVREEHLEHIRAWVAGVEKHEFGLLQMIGRETLLDLKAAAIKDINNREGKNKRKGSRSKCSNWYYNMYLPIIGSRFSKKKLSFGWWVTKYPFRHECKVAGEEGVGGSSEDSAPKQNHLLAISIIHIRCESVTVNKTLASSTADSLHKKANFTVKVSKRLCLHPALTSTQKRRKKKGCICISQTKTAVNASDGQEGLMAWR